MTRSFRLGLVALAFAATCTLVLGARPAVADDDDVPRSEIPDALKGFAGQLRGEVRRVYPDAGVFTLYVREVVDIWRHSTAARPNSAIGKTLVIHLRREHERIVARQAAWLALQEESDSVRVDVKNVEGERLVLMELNEDQRAQVEESGFEEPARDGDGDREHGEEDGHDRDGDREHGEEDGHDGDAEREHGSDDDLPEPEIPDALHGFSGRLRGEVVQVGVHGFVLRVTDVEKVWEGSKASDPQSAVGKRLLINVAWKKGDNGQWHPVETHVRYLRTLDVGNEIAIEVKNDEGDRLHILELNEDQRRAAERGD